MKPDIEIILWPFSFLDFTLHVLCSLAFPKLRFYPWWWTWLSLVLLLLAGLFPPIKSCINLNIIRDKGLSSVIARFQLINIFPHQLTLWWEIDGEEAYFWLTNLESYIQSQMWQSGVCTILLYALTILPPGGLQIMVVVVIVRLYFQVTSVSISYCRTWSYTPSWGSAMCYLVCNVIASYCITRSNLAKMGCPWKMRQLPTEPLELHHIS